MVKLVRRF